VAEQKPPAATGSSAPAALRNAADSPGAARRLHDVKLTTESASPLRKVVQLKDEVLRAKNEGLAAAFLLGTHEGKRKAALGIGRIDIAKPSHNDVLRTILEFLASDMKGERRAN
jgi:hypothetical protein